MDWRQIRSAFIRTRAKRAQHLIGKHGGLRQNAISKIEANDNLGPTVGVFVKAIQGLGLKPSEFFSEIERSETKVLKVDTEEVKNPPISAASEADDARSAIPSEGGTESPRLDDATVERIVDTVLERMGNRVQRSAKARRKKSTRSADRRARRRKTG